MVNYSRWTVNKRNYVFYCLVKSMAVQLLPAGCQYPLYGMYRQCYNELIFTKASKRYARVKSMIGKKNRIVLAEDQNLVRKGLQSLLTKDNEFEVVGEAEDGLEAIRCVAKHQPDLLLLDLAMPRMNGIAAIKEIKQQFPETKIVALTFHTSDEYIFAAFQAGVDGYCLKNDTQIELITALRRVLSGKKYISPVISDRVLEGYLESKQTIKSDSAWETLTQREKEVLKLVGEGYTSSEIGDFLCISPKTVDKHRANIMNKLDLHNVAALTAYAIEKGLID
jgi:DNA-binding NarL/FixJ family response regulator